jgi:hypothetical protein
VRRSLARPRRQEVRFALLSRAKVPSDVRASGPPEYRVLFHNSMSALIIRPGRSVRYLKPHAKLAAGERVQYGTTK